ncbi:hypothetical protein [Crossiella sp. NPDC003009]
MQATMHLYPNDPTTAEYVSEGGHGSWKLPGGRDVADDMDAWRGLAEQVAEANGFRVVEWRTKPGTGWPSATMRRMVVPYEHELVAALAPVAARHGLTVAALTASATDGGVLVELAPVR